MNWNRLVLNHIRGSAFRSGIIVLCAALVAGVLLSASVLAGGAWERLQQSLRRLGADIIVTHMGNQTFTLRGARLMTQVSNYWMPMDDIDRLQKVPGVAAVSPQLFLDTLPGEKYAADKDVYLVAFDPESDLTVLPWGDGELPKPRFREAVVGSEINIPPGEVIDLHGFEATISGCLLETGSDLDRSIFISFDTAQAVVASSQEAGGANLEIMPDSATAFLVKIEHGSDTLETSLRITADVPGVRPVESGKLFLAERTQMIGLLRNLGGLLGLIWVLTVLFIGIVFSIAVNERRREIGVLRALGATRPEIFRALLAEGAALAVIGGGIGIVLGEIASVLYHDRLAALTGVAVPLPSILLLAGAGLATWVIIIASVLLAAIYPAYRIVELDPALAMRE